MKHTTLINHYYRCGMGAGAPVVVTKFYPVQESFEHERGTVKLTGVRLSSEYGYPVNLVTTT